MRKILLALAAVSLLFVSCNKNDSGETDPMEKAFFMVSSVINQNELSLDPFNIAYRLNILINEAIANSGESVDNSANFSANTREDLFGIGAAITYDRTTGIYTITFQGAKPDNDYLRGGKVYVHTNGHPKLNEAGAEWKISTEQDSPYSISVEGLSFTMNLSEEPSSISGSVTMPVSYVITAQGESEWLVQMEHFNCWKESAFASDWTASYMIGQSGASCLPEDVQNEEYTITVSADNSKTMTFNKFSVSTDRPIRAKAGCGYGMKVPGGVINLTHTLNNGQLDECTLEWVSSETYGECHPAMKITYAGYIETVETGN